MLKSYWSLANSIAGHANPGYPSVPMGRGGKSPVRMGEMAKKVAGTPV